MTNFDLAVDKYPFIELENSRTTAPLRGLSHDEGVLGSRIVIVVFIVLNRIDEAQRQQPA
jgi:hypothetical protein